MKFLQCLGLSDIKYVEKNDREAKCKYSKEIIKKGDPVWVLTQYRQPNKFKQSLIQVPVAKKVSIEQAFGRFLLTHKQFYKILTQDTDSVKNKSLNDMLVVQLQKWIGESLKHLKKLPAAAHKLIIDQLLYKLEEKAAVEKIPPPSASHPFGGYPITQYQPRGVSAKEEKKFKKFNLHSIVFLLRYFRKNWDFASCLTSNNSSKRKLAKFLQQTDLTKPLENLETEIENWYKENSESVEVTNVFDLNDDDLDEL